MQSLMFAATLESLLLPKCGFQPTTSSTQTRHYNKAMGVPVTQLF